MIGKIFIALYPYIFFRLFTNFFIRIASQYTIFREQIKDVLPDNHKQKVGTPNIGGIIMFLSLTPMFLCELSLQLFLVSFLFASLGFFDDFIKVSNKIGLSKGKKFLLQILFSTIAALILKFYGICTIINVPFWGEIDASILSFIYYVFVYLSMVNAFNITDGLDGLLGNIAISTCLYLLFYSYMNGLDFLPIVALISSILGFLRYNMHPAKIFLGDCGAMMMGGFVGTISISIGITHLLPIICIVPFVNAATSLIQILSRYFRNGKSVFLIAPMHHRCELLGMKETNITLIFTITNYVFVLTAILLYVLKFNKIV